MQKYLGIVHISPTPTRSHAAIPNGDTEFKARLRPLSQGSSVPYMSASGYELESMRFEYEYAFEFH